MQPVDRDSNEVFKENTMREMERQKKKKNQIEHLELKIPIFEIKIH